MSPSIPKPCVTFDNEPVCYSEELLAPRSTSKLEDHPLSTSALEEGEWSASRPSRFNPRERTPGTHWIGVWMGPRAVLDMVCKKKFPAPAGIRTSDHRFMHQSMYYSLVIKIYGHRSLYALHLMWCLCTHQINITE